MVDRPNNVLLKKAIPLILKQNLRVRGVAQIFAKTNMLLIQNLKGYTFLDFIAFQKICLTRSHLS